MTPTRPLEIAFANHSRRWRDFLYCYPVISRRAKGLSVGVNLNPDKACNFDCVYCCVDRSIPPVVRRVDLGALENELRSLLNLARGRLFDEPEFREIPAAFRRINDMAFSGDGEPTASPEFPAAARLAARLRTEFGLHEAKIVTITDACFLSRPAVSEALAFLDGQNGEIWAKLDAGTEEYFRLVNRPSHTLEHVLANILAAGRVRPIVIQSLFMRVRGELPPAAEITAYAERIKSLIGQGARISLVQIYSVARWTAEKYVTRLDAGELESIGAATRAAGAPVEVYP